MVLNGSRKTNFFYYSFKASKNKQELSFYSIPEFDEWKKHIENQKAWKIKYYKGLYSKTLKFCELNYWHKFPVKRAL